MNPVPKHPLDSVLISALPDGDVFAVGGRVRDEFRAQVRHQAVVVKDLDYVVTGQSSEQVLAALRRAGRVDVVGASFSVFKFRHAAGEADIALPRRERSTGAGHRDFEVEAGPQISLEDDLGRRDFRMNMIARRLRDDAIVDPYGGVRDIQAARIDIVTPVTFEEDPLRMLRAAQFAARFEYQLSPAAHQAMSAGAALVLTVSPERIGEEFGKLLALPTAPSIGIEILRATGVLAYLWPEVIEGVGVDQNEWHAYDVYRHNLVTLDAAPAGDLTLRLAALLHDVAKPRTKDGSHFYRHEHLGADLVPQMLAKLRLPNETVDTVQHLVRMHMYSADPNLQPKAIRRFIQRIGPEHLDRLFALRAADIAGSGLPKRDDSNERFQAGVTAILAEAPPFTIKDIAISGQDVIALMIEAGKADSGFQGDRRVGEILKRLFEHVTDDPAANDASRLRAEAARLVAALY
ncbi:MAG: hypothetical protein NVS3B28_20800 [Candidatus Velthaea sp.]